MMDRSIRLAVIGLAALAVAAPLPAQKEYPKGYTDTPYQPNGKWRIHDLNRPRPEVVAPGEQPRGDQPGRPPSDAVVLFDGKDLSQWRGWKGPLGYDFIAKHDQGKIIEPGWVVENGYIEARKAGSLISKEKFGDVQLHIEWAAPETPVAASQGRGNSGVLLMGAYEIQVLDSYDNETYADGQAASIYAQYPPLVNASREPGEWQAYDIIFEAPRFAHGKLVKPAFATVFHNGVLMHHRQEMWGPMRHKQPTEYLPHAAEGPLVLQDHSNPVRFRNIWVRKLDRVQQ